MHERSLSQLALQDIGLFVEVARALSFTKASAVSGTPVATLSRRITALEKRVGVRLFERVSRRLTLTAAGQQFWQDCEQVVAAAEQAQAGLQAEIGQPTGRLRLSMPVEFGLEYLFPLLDEFARAYPKIGMVLDLNPRTVDFSEEAMDVAIRLGTVRTPNLVVRKLGMLEGGLYAAPAYLAAAGEPARPEDLSRHSCILQTYATRPGFWRLVGAEGEVEVPVQGRFTSNNVSMARLLALEGYGITIQVARVVSRAQSEGRLRRVLSAWQVPPIPVHLVMSSRLQPARVRAFVEFISAEPRRQSWLLP